MTISLQAIGIHSANVIGTDKPGNAIKDGELTTITFNIDVINKGR